MHRLQCGPEKRAIVRLALPSYMGFNRRQGVACEFKGKSTMAYTTASAAPLGAVTTYRIVTAFSAAKDALLAWNESRVTRNALAQLTDAQLEDIGLSRGDTYRF